MSTSYLNDVKNRFLTLPKSAVEGLEHEPQKTDFNFIKKLGEGSFGTVYLVSHKKTKAIYAIKTIDKSLPENLEQKANFNREIEIMYKLNHPNIVKLYGHFEDEEYCYFIMQFIPNKDLYEILPESGKKPNIKLITSIMKDLLSAVYYLHHMKPTIIHRDIKPENILLDNNNKAYLTDFGWSNYMTSVFMKRTTVCGTLLYLPPEMIQHLGHDQTVDIWCIGMLLFELITGTTPFEGNDFETLALNISNIKITWPKNMDPDAKDLTSKILKFKGKERLSIEQILSHKFFSKYFPNAVNELIKPEHQKNRTFIVSKDDPKSFEAQTSQKANKAQLSQSISSFRSNNNTSNTNININNSLRRNFTTRNPNINKSFRNDNAVKNNENNNQRNYNTNNININNNQRNNNTANIVNRNNNKKNINLNKSYMGFDKNNNKESTKINNNTSKIIVNNNQRNNNTKNINLNKSHIIYDKNNDKESTKDNNNYRSNNANSIDRKRKNIRATYVPMAKINLTKSIKSNNKINNNIFLSGGYNNNYSKTKRIFDSYDKTYISNNSHENNHNSPNKNKINLSSSYNYNINPKNTYKSPKKNTTNISSSDNSKNTFNYPINRSFNVNVNSNINTHHRFQSDENLKKYDDSNVNNNSNDKQNNFKNYENSKRNYNIIHKHNNHSMYISRQTTYNKK